MKGNNGNRDGWRQVCLARKADRIRSQDLIRALFNEFTELKGDRSSAEDPAILAGLAFFEGIPVTVIAQSKGTSLEENRKKHFGMPLPQGYRKAVRLARQAEKFRRPVITIVDTPGAYPGREAEMNGQAQAISSCLSAFSALRTPVICIVLSEGGSGGALALAVADRLCMLENAVFSILSPEGFASILYKDESLAPKAAQDMKLTSHDLQSYGLVDHIVNEPGHLTVRNMDTVSDELRSYLRAQLSELSRIPPEKLVRERRRKIAAMGVPPWLG